MPAARWAWRRSSPTGTSGCRRVVDGQTDAMKGSYLGPEFSTQEIEAFLKEAGAPAERLDGGMPVGARGAGAG